jgi:hypothetical protein
VDFRLFVSHSSPTEESQERLRDLVAEIRAKAPSTPLRVLVDAEQIVGADDWHRRIAFMLHACHGGVVLIDGAALSSKWVLAEATFLSLRQLAGECFAFLPVSFLDESDLKEEKRKRAAQTRFLSDTAWDVVAMPNVQYVRGRTPAEIADGVVSALRARGSLRPMASPVDRLADQLAPKFAEAGPQALRELADQVGDAGAYLTGNTQELAAMAIVRHMLAYGRLTSTLRQMDQLGTAFPAQRRLEILNELLPLPLPAEAAAMLTRRRASGGYSHASLRTEIPEFTVPLYVRRAHLARLPPRYFAIGNTLGSFEELCANLRQEWRGRHVRPLARPLSDAQVDERLNSPDLDLYVWVPGPVETDVLAQLEQAYPRIAFIIHYAQGGEPTALPPGVLPVTPPLTLEEEEAISVDYDAVTNSLAD